VPCGDPTCETTCVTARYVPPSRLGRGASPALPGHPQGTNAAEDADHAEDPQDYAAHDQEDHAHHEEAEPDDVGCHDLECSRGRTTSLLPRRRGALRDARAGATP
jgi:hypothetical protein